MKCRVLEHETQSLLRRHDAKTRSASLRTLLGEQCPSFTAPLPVLHPHYPLHEASPRGGTISNRELSRECNVFRGRKRQLERRHTKRSRQPLLLSLSSLPACLLHAPTLPLLSAVVLLATPKIFFLSRSPLNPLFLPAAL